MEECGCDRSPVCTAVLHILLILTMMVGDTVWKSVAVTDPLSLDLSKHTPDTYYDDGRDCVEECGCG